MRLTAFETWLMIACFCFFDFGATFLNSSFSLLIFSFFSLSVTAYFAVNAFMMAIVMCVLAIVI